VWTKSADDRAFLRELSYEIVASVATSELEDFDTLIARYFARPVPPRTCLTFRAPPSPAQITPAVPAVISAVLNMLLMEVLETAQYDQSEVVMLGLKRLFRRRGAHPNELVTLRAASASRPVSLFMIVYIYTQPVGIRVPLSQLAEVAYQAASIYGLDEARADDLVPMVIGRLSTGISPHAH
jgi:hypothetical protein